MPQLDGGKYFGVGFELEPISGTEQVAFSPAPNPECFEQSPVFRTPSPGIHPCPPAIHSTRTPATPLHPGH